MLLEKGEIVWLKGYGMADEEHNIPVDPTETVFQVGSISKSLTAWGVLHLVEQELVALDAPVEHYLRRWHLPESFYEANEVTVRRLLSHSAGLNVHGYPGYLPEESLPSIVKSLNGEGNTEQVVIRWKPGSGFHYSGGGYTVLQLVVEEVSGKLFSHYLKEYILYPLGMTHSSFEWDQELRPLTAHAYDQNGKELPHYLFAAKAVAGLYATPEDLAHFVAASMEGPAGEPQGRGVLTSETVAGIQKQEITTLLGYGYGLGCMIYQLSNEKTAITHGGTNQGWQSYYALMPEEGAGLVVLTNGSQGNMISNEISWAWKRLYEDND